MAQTPGDDKTEPSLELPSLKLPGFGRRKKDKQRGKRVSGTRTSEQTVTEPVEEATSSPAEEVTVPEREDARAAQPVQEPSPQPVQEPTPEPEQTQPILRQPSPEPEPTQEIPAPPQATAPAVEKPRRKAKRERKAPTMPKVSGRVASVVTGVLVAIVGGAGTYGALGACEAVRGVSTCGGPPGFFILVAIVVLMVLFGSLLLSLFGVTDPGSTSFLAVGVMTVVVMLVLLPVMFSLWMFLVFPVLGVASYLLAHWVTTRFETDPSGRRDWM